MQGSNPSCVQVAVGFTSPTLHGTLRTPHFGQQPHTSGTLRHNSPYTSPAHPSREQITSTPRHYQRPTPPESTSAAMLSGVAAQPGEFIEMREYTLQPDGHKAYMASEPM